MITAKWANIEDEGALHALLRRLESGIAVERIDELWIFPTRRASGAESTVLVVSAFGDDPARRRVGAVHFKVVRDRKGAATVEQDMREYATAPADAVARAVEGVLRRLGDDASQSPRWEPIGGDPSRFETLVRELGGGPAPAVERPEEEPDDAPEAEPGAAEPEPPR
ncbi:MAG: hypothetical protein PVH00_01790 [Gemmatimonadota bacterium]|jgi:hypothetical protein